MTNRDDMQNDPPAVGAWLLLWAFVLVVGAALAYGASNG